MIFRREKKRSFGKFGLEEREKCRKVSSWLVGWLFFSVCPLSSLSLILSNAKVKALKSDNEDWNFSSGVKGQICWFCTPITVVNVTTKISQSPDLLCLFGCFSCHFYRHHPFRESEGEISAKNHRATLEFAGFFFVSFKKLKDTK